MIHHGIYWCVHWIEFDTFPAILMLNAPVTTKVVCFSRLLKCLRSLYRKQCGPRSDCSYLFWVQAVFFYTLFISNVRQLFAADDFSRQHFQMHFFLGALRDNNKIELSQTKLNAQVQHYLGSSWALMVHTLIQFAVAEKSYMNLGFLEQRWFRRQKDVSGTGLTIKAPITTAADDNFSDIFPNFRKK